MDNKNPSLSERQHMILSHVVNHALRDPDKMSSTLKDLPGTLQNLGATDDDVKAIQSYATHLGKHVQDNNNNVGMW